MIVPDDLDYNGDRQFQMLQTAYKKIGVKLHEISGGDGTQAYTMITAPGGKYLTADMYTWYWHPYIDPDFNLSVVTRAQWDNNSDTGMDDPKYDRWYAEQARLVDFKQRQALVWKMEAYLAQQTAVHPARRHRHADRSRRRVDRVPAGALDLLQVLLHGPAAVVTPGQSGRSGTVRPWSRPSRTARMIAFDP